MRDGMLDQEQFSIYKKDNTSGNEIKLEVDYWQSGNGIYKENGISVAGKVSQEADNNDEISVMNMPNPFTIATTISFTLAKDEHVNIVVYNALGDVVTRLTDDNYSAGKHEILFDANNLPAGLYFYKFNAGSYTETHTMNLIK